MGEGETVALEFVGGSISSHELRRDGHRRRRRRRHPRQRRQPEHRPGDHQRAAQINPWVDQADFDHHGYGLVEASRNGFECTLKRLETIKRRSRAAADDERASATGWSAARSRSRASTGRTPSVASCAPHDAAGGVERLDHECAALAQAVVQRARDGEVARGAGRTVTVAAAHAAQPAAVGARDRAALEPHAGAGAEPHALPAAGRGAPRRAASAGAADGQRGGGLLAAGDRERLVEPGRGAVVAGQLGEPPAARGRGTVGRGRSASAPASKVSSTARAGRRGSRRTSRGSGRRRRRWHSASAAAPDSSMRRPGSGWPDRGERPPARSTAAASSGVRATAEPTRARARHGPAACSSRRADSSSAATLMATRARERDPGSGGRVMAAPAR